MSVEAAIGAYLTRVWDGPVSIRGFARIPGGASRETYRFDATDAAGTTHRLILRREPEAGLIDTDSEVEFRAYQSAAGIVPVPRAVALERDGAELGRPFFLTERIDGGEVAGPFTRTPFGDHAVTLGAVFFGDLGRLAAADVLGTPLAAHAPAPAPEDCWRVALDYWQGVIDVDAVTPQPIARAAIRRLRASPPPPPTRVALVHGDYRSGNVLHDGQGRILAMLDWEMAHLGDPLEDLGWALNPIWDHLEPGLACGMIPPADAIATWEAASGLGADRDALDWWILFNAVKGCAIWTSAWREYLRGGRIDPVLAISGWYVARRQDAIVAALLGGAEPAAGPPAGEQSDLAHALTGAGLVAAGAGQAAAAHDAFGGSTMLVAGVMALLAAQEAERAAAWRAADIAAMCALTGEAAGALDDLSLSALDVAWARLADALIRHHDAVAAAGQDEHAILDFYRESAARRLLAWPM